VARVTERGDEARVKPLELFFDLVFVFAITQVTALVSARPTWLGLAQGVLVFGVLWWAWAAYAWLTNTVDPEEGGVRLAMFAAMAAMLVVSLAVPHAFGDDALLFALAYAGVRAAHIVLYTLPARGDPALLSAVLGLVPGSLLAALLLVGAAFLDGWTQVAIWALALVIDLAGPAIHGMQGWRLSPGHFAERHALIVIIALGESIVALGVGVGGREVDAGIVAAAVVGIVAAAALWWAYFDVVALVAERRLREARGLAQIKQARDSYSYLHLPMVAGIILFAVGVKKTLEHVGDPLKPVPVACLCGGLALYLLAHVAFRLRNVRTLNKQRLVTAALLVALIPAGLELPALASLSIASGLLAALIAYEALRFAEARHRVRHAPEPAA
jgi:low temperature requirement protein LtrA